MLTQVSAVWTGFSGAPGYTNFHFSGEVDETTVEGPITKVRQFFQEVMPQIPPNVQITVESEVTILDESTGALIGYVTNPNGSFSYDGTAAETSYSAASGAVINWNTDTVNRGRRVRGRTFLVPLSNKAYEDDGSLNLAALTGLNAGADSIRDPQSGDVFCVWSRPRNGAGGTLAPVTSHRASDMAAVLRSRRD